MKFLQSSSALALAFCLGVTVSSADASSMEILPAERMPASALTLPAGALISNKRGDNLLEQLASAHFRREDWRTLARRHGIRLDGESLLLEVRLKSGASLHGSNRVVREHGLRVHAQNVPSLMDAWVPVGALASLKASPAVHSVRPAREVQLLGRRAFKPTAGSVTTEGVAQSGLTPYHALGADGAGSIIALVDGGFVGWSALQASGDWPGGAQLRRFVVDGSTVHECTGVGDPAACSNFDDPGNGDHGTNTMEIAYDMAPGATFWVYQTTYISEWYAAIDHASDSTNHGGQRADILSASLGAPLDGIGDGSACPPIWGSPCGSIAEISEIARSRGTLVVNAAGNEREEHWGGLYAPSAGDPDYLDWDGVGAQINYIGDGTGSAWCIPDGFPLRAQLHWDDWSGWPTHDYDLELHEYDGNGWSFVTSSNDWQDGSSGQTPQEAIAVSASNTSGAAVCGPTDGIYGFAVTRYSAATNRNLQFFGPFDMDERVFARSLGFPADSAAVFTVGALDTGGSHDQHSSFSSEGPVLAPGGGLPPPADPPKPDGMNFSWVSTATAGPGGSPNNGFSGTSAATPHVAGIAAVLNQLRLEKPAQTATNGADALHGGLIRVGLDGDNDLGASGHDTRFGAGRIRLRECSQAVSITAGAWHQVALPCDRRADDSIAATFGTLGLGSYGTDWIVSQFDPVGGSYSHMNAGDSLELGASYWLYSYNSAGGTLAGLVPDITAPWPVDVTGSSGLGRAWMLSNPRRFSLDWNELRFFYARAEHDFATAVSAGKVRSIMWQWDPGTGSYSEYNGLVGEGTLAPGATFWARMLDDVQVRFPVETGGGASLAATRPGDWMVTVQLEGQTAYAAARFGHHHAARGGFDDYDAEHLPPMATPEVRLSFHGNRLHGSGSELVRDIRSPKARDEWLMHLDSQVGARAVLHWDGPAEILAATELIDEATGKRIPLARRGNGRGGYDLVLEPGTRVLRWRFSKYQSIKRSWKR